MNDRRSEPELTSVKSAVHETESLTRKVVLGSGWSSLTTAGRQVLSFVGVAIVAHLLGPEAYGVMGMATVVTVFLLNFRDLGTAAAIIQRTDITPRLLSSLFWINVSFGFVLFVVVFGVAGPAAVFFHEPRLVGVLRALSVSFWLTAAAAVQSALLTREMAFGVLGLIDLAAAAGGYGVAISSALAGFGVWSLVFASLSNSIVLLLLTWAFCKWRPAFEFDVSEVRSIAGFSLNLSGFGLVNYFNRNADNLIIGRALGATPLGYYQAAYNLMLYPIQNVSSVIGQVLLPAFSKIKHDNARFRSAYVRSCMLIGVITFPALAGLGVVAEPFVRAVLGPQWATVAPILQVLVPVGIVQSVQTTVGHIYIAKGRTDWMFRWGLLASAILVTSFLVGIRFGLLGVAIAYAASYLTVITFVGFWIPFRLIELTVREFAVSLAPQIAITALMVLACLAWQRLLSDLQITDAWTCLVSTAAVGGVTYALLLVGLRPRVVLEAEAVLHESGSRFGRVAASILGVFARS